MANQIALSGVIASVCEAITYAKSVGLDVQKCWIALAQAQQEVGRCLILHLAF